MAGLVVWTARRWRTSRRMGWSGGLRHWRICRRINGLRIARNGLLDPNVIVDRLNRLMTGWANDITSGGWRTTAVRRPVTWNGGVPTSLPIRPPPARPKPTSSHPTPLSPAQVYGCRLRPASPLRGLKSALRFFPMRRSSGHGQYPPLSSAQNLQWLASISPSGLSDATRSAGFTHRSLWQWQRGSDATGWSSATNLCGRSYQYVPHAAEVGLRLRAYIYTPTVTETGSKRLLRPPTRWSCGESCAPEVREVFAMDSHFSELAERRPAGGHGTGYADRPCRPGAVDGSADRLRNPGQIDRSCVTSCRRRHRGGDGTAEGQRLC